MDEETRLEVESYERWLASLSDEKRREHLRQMRKLAKEQGW